jgi:hypothetical protein
MVGEVSGVGVELGVGLGEGLGDDVDTIAVKPEDE